MTTTAQQLRDYRGAAIWSLGLRPFFLGAAIWAVISVLIWLPLLYGAITLPSLFEPIKWHAHELIFGYLPAVMVGFLLTAIPNWTGRLPVAGRPLAGLFFVWVAGRIAILTSAWIGAVAAAVIDLSFLVLFAALMAREIIASGKFKSLRLLIVVTVLVVANGLFHAQNAFGFDSGLSDGIGFRMGLAAAVMLIMIIGGRVVPSFTRNWLARRKSQTQTQTQMPVSFDKFDAASIAVGGAALASWVLWPFQPVTGLMFVFAFALHIMRLSRWQGLSARREAIVYILHVGYLFVPAGFLFLSLSILFPGMISQSGALHAWTAGAIAMMTLAIMTRASLGHSGRAIQATRPIKFIYLMAFCAVVARLVAAFGVATGGLLQLSVICWVAAFLGFALIYWPVLTRPRL